MVHLRAIGKLIETEASPSVYVDGCKVFHQGARQGLCPPAIRHPAKRTSVLPEDGPKAACYKISRGRGQENYTISPGPSSYTAFLRMSSLTSS